MLHELKTWEIFFQAIWIGSKAFEVRINDRDFKPGDKLLLKEWDNEKMNYTGRHLHLKITYVLHGGQLGIENGYVVLSIAKF